MQSREIVKISIFRDNGIFLVSSKRPDSRIFCMLKIMKNNMTS